MVEKSKKTCAEKLKSIENSTFCWKFRAMNKLFQSNFNPWIIYQVTECLSIRCDSDKNWSQRRRTIWLWKMIKIRDLKGKALKLGLKSVKSGLKIGIWFWCGPKWIRFKLRISIKAKSFKVDFTGLTFATLLFGKDLSFKNWGFVSKQLKFDLILKIFKSFSQFF